MTDQSAPALRPSPLTRVWAAAAPYLTKAAGAVAIAVLSGVATYKLTVKPWVLPPVDPPKVAVSSWPASCDVLGAVSPKLNAIEGQGGQVLEELRQYKRDAEARVAAYRARALVARTKVADPPGMLGWAWFKLTK